MKKLFIMLILLLTMILVACNDNDQIVSETETSGMDVGKTNITNATEETKERVLLTQAELLELTDLSWDDLDMIDVNDFIWLYGLTKESIKAEDVHILLAEYTQKYLRPYEKMIFLIHNDAVGGPLPPLDNARYIYFFQKHGFLAESVLYDLRENKMIHNGYGRNIDIVEYFTEATITSLPNKEKNKILENLPQLTADWQEWYNGHDAGATEGFNWRLVVDFGRGEMYRLGGYGCVDGTPRNYMEVVDLLCAPVPEFSNGRASDVLALFEDWQN